MYLCMYVCMYVCMYALYMHNLQSLLKKRDLEEGLRWYRMVLWLHTGGRRVNIDKGRHDIHLRIQEGISASAHGHLISTLNNLVLKL